MIRTLWKYLKTSFLASPFYTGLGIIFIILFRLLQLSMDLTLKFATDSILQSENIWDTVLPFTLFFLAMMLGGNTGNLNNLLNTLFTKNAVKIFTKRFMKRSYDEKQDSFYNGEFYNEYFHLT